MYYLEINIYIDGYLYHNTSKITILDGPSYQYKYFLGEKKITKITALNYAINMSRIIISTLYITPRFAGMSSHKHSYSLDCHDMLATYAPINTVTHTGRLPAILHTERIKIISSSSDYGREELDKSLF